MGSAGFCPSAVGGLIIRMGLGVYDSIVFIWLAVKIRVPFWVLDIIRHLVFRVPNKAP